MSEAYCNITLPTIDRQTRWTVPRPRVYDTFGGSILAWESLPMFAVPRYFDSLPESKQVMAE